MNIYESSKYNYALKKFLHFLCDETCFIHFYAIHKNRKSRKYIKNQNIEQQLGW